MRLSLTFEPQEIETVRSLVSKKQNEGRRIVQFRWQRNVEGQPPAVDDAAMWMAHIMCLLTTQQRSGPGSSINRLLDQRPFPLALTVCRSQSNLRDYVFELLTNAQGIRRTNRIADAMHANLRFLERGGWNEMCQWRDRLLAQRRLPPDPSQRALEEAAAAYMDQLAEFGSKQSRNFWQSLGLARYVFVLDSRVLSWLRRNLNLPRGMLTNSGLSDPQYYQFISNLLFELCDQAGVLPCMFDAAVFDSFDEGKEWGSDEIW